MVSTVQKIFEKGYPTYEQMHRLPNHIRKAARSILACRTAALGGYVQACPVCGKRLVCLGVFAAFRRTQAFAAQRPSEVPYDMAA